MNMDISNRLSKQSGYALILMVVGLLGIGGVVATGFTQQAKVKSEEERFRHNQRVLEEAKRALLQYAYNNPVINGTGPGRLPNADVDNDGVSDGGNTFGRLPWNDPDLNLHDLRDANGERLWYVVSTTFRPQALQINSTTSGNIHLLDQAGNVYFDGSNPGGLDQYGAAAVIIAPGAEIDRNGVPQNRAAGVNNSTNYLDLIAGTEDNATYTAGFNDGLILGPVGDQVNDQFIVITAAEVIAMAEKATLQAYREAIDDYLDITGGVYPWLFNYHDGSGPDGLQPDELSDLYPAQFNFATERTTNLTSYGRIPSIFGTYFGTETTNTFTGRLRGEYEYDFGSLGAVVSSGHGTLNFNSDILTEPFEDIALTNDIGFVDLDGTAGQESRFTATLGSPIIDLRDYFFSEDRDFPGGFNICPDDGDGVAELEDCHRDVVGNPNPGGAHQYNLRILRVQLMFEIPVFPPGPVINLDTDHAVNPPSASVITAPDGNDHATIEVQYDLANVLPSGNFPANINVTANYQIDENYLVGEAVDYTPGTPGTLDVSNLLVDSRLTINLRYYPELPAWAFTNGWHDSMRMAYADVYSPDVYIPGVSPPCTPGVNCLRVVDIPGSPQDKEALLVLAGQNDWNDEAGDGLLNDLTDVFDPSNADLADDNPALIDEDFAIREGNDEILAIE